MKHRTTVNMRPLLVLALVALLSAEAVAMGSESNVATFSVTDLLTGRRSDEFATVLATTGLLAIKIDTEESEGTLTQDAALHALCRCDQLLTVEGTDTAILDDEKTVRKTLATATAGTTPLPLPDSLATHCGQATVASLEALRDQVATASDAFVVALDRLLGAGPLLKNAYGGTYSSVSQIRQEANHLEHFHVYSKERRDYQQREEHERVLDWHTDAGLFLAFVPARDCHSDQPDASFWVKDIGSPAVFSDGAIAIMLGAGTEYWLQTPIPLKATQHAVKMRPGEERAWYGMMHLVPEIAIVRFSPERTFGDMKKAMVLSTERSRTFGDEAEVSIGCGLSHDPPITPKSLHRRRRRLQMVQDPSACNNSTNFFCWMSCLDIPSHQQAQEYSNEGYSLYCLDPGVLASSGNNVSRAMEPCNGQTHNSNCLGSWQPTAPGVDAAPVNLDAPLSSGDEPFCYGGTSMYMDGFHWKNTVCIIFLFPRWILSTRGKLAGASMGTIAFGAALEKVIEQRRLVVTSLKPGYCRLGASALFYGLQLTMGYFLMLVVMTFSGPLFMCVVLGLVSGHILFTAKDAIFAHKEKKEYNVAANGKVTSSSEEEFPECCCVDVKDDAGVPEGSTPCCQNTL